MKQKLLKSIKLRALMLVAVILCTGFTSAWGETYTYDFSTGGVNGSSSNTWTTSYFTILQEKGTSSTNVANYLTAPRWYQNHLITFTPATNITISQIVVNCSSNNNGQTISASIGSVSANGNNSTWTGSISSSSPLVLTMGKQCRPTSIEVTYAISGSTPSLSVSPSSIVFGEKAINSTYTETFDVTFSNLTQDLSVSGFTGVTVSPTTISKTATSPQTVTITYAPTAEGSINGNITVSNTADQLSQSVAVTGSAYDASNVPNYNLFTGNIEEGDYIIYYNGYALKNTIASNRFGYATVTPSGNVITTIDESIVWHIAPNGNYWTLYNESVSKYAAGTSTKNQGALIDEITDLAKWTVSVSDGGYQFENLGRSNATNDSGNKWLRNNGTNGFACYASTTGGALTLYKLNDGTPSISAENVALEYYATSGSIAYTLTNPVIGTALTAAVADGSWLTLGTVGETAIPFTCTANESTEARTATVTLTYGSVTKTVTVTQAAAPVIYTTIPALFEAATSTETAVNVTFNNWVVSGVSTNGKNVFVTDNAGNGFVIYSNEDQSSTYSVGSILSGTAVPCTLKKYNGFAELLNVNASVLTITTGGTVTASNIAMADLAGVNTGALVSYENLTCSVDDSGSSTKYFLSDGTTTIQVFNTLYAFDALEDGKTYNITGIYQQYGNTKEILPRSAADIEEVEVQHQVFDLTVTLGSNVSIYVFNAAVQTNPLIADGAAGTIQVTDGTQIMVSPDVAEGYVLESLTVGGQDVTSQIDESGAYTFIMPSQAVTITATAVEYVVPAEPVDCIYQLATSVTSGKHYVIVGTNEDDTYVMGEQKSNNRGAVAATIDNGLLTTSSAYEFVIEGNSTDGYTIMQEGGYLYAASSNSNYLKTRNDNNDANGVWSINNSDGLATIQAKGGNTRNLMRFNPNNGTPLFACYASSSTTGSLPALYEKVTESVIVSSVSYGTYASDNALDFTDSGIKAFYATLEGSTLTFHEITKVPANTGVLLYADGGATADVPAIASSAADATTGNVFVRGEGTAVSYSDQTPNYVLFNGEDGIGFYKANNNNVATNRAYVRVPAGTLVKSFAINLDDTDAIGAIKTANGNADIFNLAGQRVSKAQKGIYIINGKKVLVK